MNLHILLLSLCWIRRLSAKDVFMINPPLKVSDKPYAVPPFHGGDHPQILHSTQGYNSDAECRSPPTSATVFVEFSENVLEDYSDGARTPLKTSCAPCRTGTRFSYAPLAKHQDLDELAIGDIRDIVVGGYRCVNNSNLCVEATDGTYYQANSDSVVIWPVPFMKNKTPVMLAILDPTESLKELIGNRIEYGRDQLLSWNPMKYKKGADYPYIEIEGISCNSCQGAISRCSILSAPSKTQLRLNDWRVPEANIKPPGESPVAARAPPMIEKTGYSYDGPETYSSDTYAKPQSSVTEEPYSNLGYEENSVYIQPDGMNPYLDPVSDNILSTSTKRYPVRGMERESDGAKALRYSVFRSSPAPVSPRMSSQDKDDGREIEILDRQVVENGPTALSMDNIRRAPIANQNSHTLEPNPLPPATSAPSAPLIFTAAPRQFLPNLSELRNTDAQQTVQIREQSVMPSSGEPRVEQRTIFTFTEQSTAMPIHISTLPPSVPLVVPSLNPSFSPILPNPTPVPTMFAPNPSSIPTIFAQNLPSAAAILAPNSPSVPTNISPNPPPVPSMPATNSPAVSANVAPNPPPAPNMLAPNSPPVHTVFAPNPDPVHFVSAPNNNVPPKLSFMVPQTQTLFTGAPQIFTSSLIPQTPRTFSRLPNINFKPITSTIAPPISSPSFTRMTTESPLITTTQNIDTTTKTPSITVISTEKFVDSSDSTNIFLFDQLRQNGGLIPNNIPSNVPTLPPQQPIRVPNSNVQFMGGNTKLLPQSGALEFQLDAAPQGSRFPELLSPIEQSLLINSIIQPNMNNPTPFDRRLVQVSELAGPAGPPGISNFFIPSQIHEPNVWPFNNHVLFKSVETPFTNRRLFSTQQPPVSMTTREAEPLTDVPTTTLGTTMTTPESASSESATSSFEATTTPFEFKIMEPQPLISGPVPPQKETAFEQKNVKVNAISKDSPPSQIPTWQWLMEHPARMRALLRHRKMLL